MAVVKKTDKRPKAPLRPAISLEGRENQMISLAMDLAEEQLRNGTATSQVITQFLKLGTTRELLEQDRLRQENEMLRAKIKQIDSQSGLEDMYKAALDAMREYSGGGPAYDDDDEDEDED